MPATFENILKSWTLTFHCPNCDNATAKFLGDEAELFEWPVCCWHAMKLISRRDMKSDLMPALPAPPRRIAETEKPMKRWPVYRQVDYDEPETWVGPPAADKEIKK